MRGAVEEREEENLLPQSLWIEVRSQRWGQEWSVIEMKEQAGT